MQLCANLLQKLNKIAVISNFLAFFFLFLFEKLSLLDPGPGGKMNADPCGSGYSPAGRDMWDPIRSRGRIPPANRKRESMFECT